VKIVASLLLTTLFAIRPQTRFQSPLETTARTMLTNFVAGRFDAATIDFNDELRPVVTPALLAEVKAQLDQQAGAFYLVKEAHPRVLDGFRAIELIAQFEKAPVSVVVVFDPLDRVRAVYFNPILAPAVDPALERVAREVLANFTAGRYDEAVKPFDAEMRKQLSPANMAGLAASVTEKFGTFRSVTEVHQRIETSRIIDMVLSYTKSPVSFRVTFDAQGRVTALRIAPFIKE
jgi:hypothetical protein